MNKHSTWSISGQVTYITSCGPSYKSIMAINYTARVLLHSNYFFITLNMGSPTTYN